MGTNYYAIPIVSDSDKKKMIQAIKKENWTTLNNLQPKEIHIGKSSGGWKFLFNHNNWEYFDQTKESFENFINNSRIINEYNKEISCSEFWDIVEAKTQGLDGTQYAKRYNEFHPHDRTPTPRYIDNKEKTDEYHFGYRFSLSTEFS